MALTGQVRENFNHYSPPDTCFVDEEPDTELEEAGAVTVGSLVQAAITDVGTGGVGIAADRLARGVSVWAMGQGSACVAKRAAWRVALPW